MPPADMVDSHEADDAVAQRFGVRLAELTTIGLGGPARKLIEPESEEELIRGVATADASAERLLLLGGGSNLVIGDAGFDGTVVRLATRGHTAIGHGERVRLRVAAGEPWDDVVARAVGDGLAGLECLSGIPGLSGATPIQNVGAYGQAVSDTIVSVRAYDRDARRVVDLAAADCRFSYRSSRFRHSARYVLLEVTFELVASPLALPIAYPELARALGVAVGERAPLAAVRDAVINLRRSKGMILSAEDPDSVSAGSFFVNPILPAAEFAALVRRVHDLLGPEISPPAWPEGAADGEEAGAVKTSAAWLIERAGFARGYGQGRVGVSAKHTLALVNRGGATTAELIALAREIRDGVMARFGVELRPEPTLLNVEL